MIRFNWRRDSDNAEMAHVSVTWSLTRTDLADAIIAAVMPATYEAMAAEISKGELEQAVRDLLHRNAEKRFWWADEYQKEYAGEPSVDEVLQWGLKQAARF